MNLALIKTRGNTKSLINCLRSMDLKFDIIDPTNTITAKELATYNRIILPGVGHIADYSSLMERSSFDTLLQSYIADSDNRLLGICVGFQYLSEFSTEDSCANCLGLLPLSFHKFSKSIDIRVPHVGWNTVTCFQSSLPALELYFTHSYAAFCSLNHKAKDYFTEYGITTYSVDTFYTYARKDNVYGIQGHPEKSKVAGHHFLSNFIWGS